eukprot:14186999-Heterocapsa_arctica.AAC.1
MFADVSSAVNTGCFFIPADPDRRRAKSNREGSKREHADCPAGEGYGRPYHHEHVAPGTVWGDVALPPINSWVKQEQLTNQQIDIGMAQVFDALLRPGRIVDAST